MQKIELNGFPLSLDIQISTFNQLKPFELCFGETAIIWMVLVMRNLFRIGTLDISMPIRFCKIFRFLCGINSALL